MDKDREDADLVELTNDMLRQLHVTKRVHSFADINASVFVTLFEGLCGEQLPDIIRGAGRSLENDAHNVQSVIDTLSLDVLRASLSHITGEDVVRGNRTAINNLLQVFHGLLEYVLETIDSEISTDAEEEKRMRDVNSEHTLSDVDDPDRLTSELIDDILEKELGVGYNHRRHAELSNGRAGTETDNTANTDELIALGRDISQSQGSIDNTVDLIRLGQQPMKTHVTVTNHLLSGAEPKTVGGPQMEMRHALPADDRRPSYASSGGNVADISSESHAVHPPPPTSIPAVWLDTSKECSSGVSRRDVVPPHTWPERKVHDLPTVGLGGSAPTKVIRETSPVLDSSHSSSVTLPQKPPLAAHSSTTNSEFIGVGMRPRVAGLAASVPGRSDRRSDGRTDVHPVGRRKTSAAHHTFTHHLYHHYDDVPVTNGVRQGTDLAASLPISFSSGVQQKERQHHIASGVTSAGDLLSSQHASPPVRDNANKVTQRTAESSRLPPPRSPSYEDLLSQLSQSMRSSGAAARSRSSKVAPSGGATDGDNSVKQSRAPSQEDRHNAINRRYNRDKCEQADRFIDKKVITSPGRRADRSHLKVSFLADEGNVSSHAGRSLDGHRYAGGDGLTTEERAAMRNEHNVARHHGDAASHELHLAAAARHMKPTTFSEYLQKYYGHTRGESQSDDAESYFSDGVVNYGTDRHHSGGFLAEMERCLKKMKKKAKSVRFEDVLDDGATGDAGSIRRRLKRQDERYRIRTQLLDKVYRDELDAYDEELREIEKRPKQVSKDKEMEFRQKVLVKRKPKRVSASVLYSPKRGRSRVQSRARKRSASASPSIGRHLQDYTPPSGSSTDGSLLTGLLAEFPNLHLSSETLHELWRKSARQVESLSRAEREVRSRKSKCQVEIEEAERRQKILLGVMKKELAHNQRMRDRKERLSQQHSVSAALRERRQQSARARRYYEQYQLQMRAKMLKKRTKEEQIFKKLFREGLDIQKERIREMRRYVKDQREQRAEKHHNEITSLENYYKDQFSILTESLAKERNDMEVRESSQTKILEQMKRQLRKKMESEVRNFQHQLCRDEDDAFYRQLDADRMRQRLQMTRFQAQI